MRVAILAQSAPTFWLGILLIILFAVTLGWLPAGGTARGAAGLVEALRFLLLPVATLAIVNLAAYARQAMAAMQAALREPYIRTARMKGAAGARRGLAPRLPQRRGAGADGAALDAGALVSGALITETIFARPGMGKLIYDAVMGNDYNLALLALLLAALVTMLATLAADLGAAAARSRGCAR